MVMQAQVTGARPLNQPAQQLAGTPHIPVSTEYVNGLIGQINNLYSTPEHQRFEQLPATPGRLNPEAVAEQAALPDVQITTLQLHPNVEASEEPAASGPIQVAQGVSNFDLVAALAPGLSGLSKEAANEQAVLAGAA